MDLMAKEVFSLSETWIFTPLNLPENHIVSFFSSLQLWSWFWISEIKRMFPTSSFEVIWQFPLIRVTTDMAVNTHRTPKSQRYFGGSRQKRSPDSNNGKTSSRSESWDFPGGSVVRTLCFHCGGEGSIPGGELRSCKLCATAEKKKVNSQTNK